MKYKDFEAFGGARDFVNYRGECIIHGPAETGKTISALFKLHICATTYPKASIVIARKTLASTYATVLQTFQNKVIDGLGYPSLYGGAKAQWFDYPNGSRIWITGLDKSGKVLSAEHDLIYVNQAEELSLDDWEILTTRTTGRAGNMPYSQTIGDANPAYPTHWMYTRPSLRLFYSRHEENPVLFDQTTGEVTEQGRTTMAVLDALTGMRKQRLRYGKAAQAEGAIYEDWNEAIHLIYEEDLPKSFAFLVGGQDWGYSNPGCFGAWGIDGDGRMYLLAQIYRRGERSDWWAERAAEVQEELCTAWRKKSFLFVACDPSQPEFIETFKSHDLRAEGGFNKVQPGIEAVQGRLETKPDGRARLFVLRDCSRYIDMQLKDEEKPYRIEDEFPAYVWADRKTKDEPIKKDDHGLDMTRYVAARLDNLGVPKKKKARMGWA